MPLTLPGEKRIAWSMRAARRRAMFPYGYIERVLRCGDCGRKGMVRSIPRWNTVAVHTCPGPWTLGGFTEGPQ
jgi:hypothetical protein